MAGTVHLVAVFDPRPPGEAVDLYQHYFQTHHAFWRVACRLLGMQITFVRWTEVERVAGALVGQAEPFVWFDKPPLPVRYHHTASERLWSHGIPSAPSPREFQNSWNIATWFPRLQSAFVRQPATAILDEQTIRSIAGDMAFHDEEVFENASVVTALENTLRAVEPLGGAKTRGAKEVLRPWFGWSPFWDLEGSAPWESRRIVSLRNLGPFLVQQQANWGLEVGGIALQYLPREVDDIPSIRTYVLGGAPVWWSARNRMLQGERLQDFRLWPERQEPHLMVALLEIVRTVTAALGVTEFVLETVSTPETYVLDVRPYSAVFESHSGAHLATTLCLAAYLQGVALGEPPAVALSRLPSYRKIATVLRDLGHAKGGHGPFHLGPAGRVLRARPEAARGAE